MWNPQSRQSPKDVQRFIKPLTKELDRFDDGSPPHAPGNTLCYSLRFFAHAFRTRILLQFSLVKILWNAHHYTHSKPNQTTHGEYTRARDWLKTCHHPTNLVLWLMDMFPEWSPVKAKICLRTVYVWTINAYSKAFYQYSLAKKPNLFSMACCSALFFTLLTPRSSSLVTEDFGHLDLDVAFSRVPQRMQLIFVGQGTSKC